MSKDQDYSFLVVGADNDGMIGHALANELLNAGETVYKTTRLVSLVSNNTVFLDLSGDITYWEPPKSITTAYLCAAVSSLNECRKFPVETANINVHNTLAIARKLISNGSFVVFLSTSAVFDGSVSFYKENDPTNPQTEYGRQKAAVEKNFLALGNSSAVVRLTKVISSQTALLQNWISSLKNHQVIHPFSDMVMSPLPLPYVIDVLYRVGYSRLAGIFHVSASEDITYEQVGRYIARRIGADQKLVQPIKALESSNPPETIPRHTTLDTSRIGTEFGMTALDPWSAIEYIFEH